MENKLTAQQLRIGNYYNHNGEIRQVTPNTILEVWEAEREWCKPIPLTEEWLLKLPNNFIYPKWITFVHDLQNWFYYNNQKKELEFLK